MKNNPKELKKLFKSILEQYGIDLSIKKYDVLARTKELPSSNTIIRALGGSWMQAKTLVLGKQIGETAKEQVEIDKELIASQISSRYINEKYKKLLKEKVFQDRIIDIIREGITALPTVDIPKKIITPKGITKEDAVLLFSDAHIGEVVSKEETGGFGEYNFDMFIARMEMLFEKIIELVIGKMQGYQVDKLHIIGLGDIVCLEENTLIQLKNGTVKPIQDIKINDEILGRLGISLVSAIHNRNDKKELIQIKSVGNTIISSTPEHKWLVIPDEKVNKLWNKSNGGFWQRKKKYLSIDSMTLKPASKLIKGDYLLQRFFRPIKTHTSIDIEKITNIKLKRNTEKKYYYENVRGNKPKINYKKVKLTKDFLWLYGIYLAEGSIVKCRNKDFGVGVIFTLNINETNLASKIKIIIKKTFGESITVKFDERKSHNVLNVVIYNKIIATLFMNLSNKGNCYTKNIHNDIWTSSVSLLPIVGGWLDGDGSNKTKHYIIGKTASKDLAFQIRQLCGHEGVFCNHWKDKRQDHIFYVRLSGKYAKTISKYTVKYIESQYTNGYEEGVWVGPYYACRVREVITKSYNGIVYDLTIDGDPYYQAAGYICHNSGQIHAELVETANDSVIEWTLGGALIISQFLIDLSRHFKHIEFTGVVGNHGRMTKDVRFKQRYVNWDYLLYVISSLMCINQKNIVFDIPKSFFTMKKISGQNYLILHGDNIKGYRSIPWYGIERAVNELSQLLSSQNKIFQHVFLGHFHNQGILDKIIGEVILNGSVIGGNEYSLGKLFKSADPKQMLMGVNSKYGPTWRFPINLREAKIKQNPRYKYEGINNLNEQIRSII